MQQIHVKRYESTAAGYAGTIEPEDRSWVLFIANDGTPSLYIGVTSESEDGKTEHGYVSSNDLPSA